MKTSNPASPWAMLAPAEMIDGDRLCEMEAGSLSVRAVSSGSGIFAVIRYEKETQIGLRVAFPFGGSWQKTAVDRPSQDEVRITASCEAGTYSVTLMLHNDTGPLFHYRSTFTPSAPMLIPFYPRDIIPMMPDGKFVEGNIHLAQEGTRTGHLLFDMKAPAATALYLQDLTSISTYAQQTKTSLSGCVGGKWPEIGFGLPPALDEPLEAGTAVVISDAWLALTDGRPGDKDAAARVYLELLAAIYPFIQKPETAYRDWPAIAARGLEDLRDNKGCWTQANGKSYLNAYVCDYDTPPEVMVQLAVLVPLMEYADWMGVKDETTEALRRGLPDFFDAALGVMCRWLPSLQDRLDHSEMQKSANVMDSWYLHHPLMNLARLARRGDRTAKKLLLGSLDYTLKVAHHFRYDWPVFYDMNTLEVLRATSRPGKGGERDVPGAYAHLMLQLRDLTGEKRFGEEARKAVKKMEKGGFDIFYQANNTAFSAVALLRLFKETKERRFLDQSYTCLACLFANMQLWDGKYGFGSRYSRFFCIYPLSDAPYTAPYEELEVYAALTYYLQESLDVALNPSIRMLLAEFIRYFVYRMPFYYPSNLLEEAVSENPKTGEVDRALMIPLEDLRDGWEQSGQVGQEVYGAAGAGYGIVPRQYFKCSDGVMVYSDYPVFRFRRGASSASFELGGDPSMRCRIRIFRPRDVTARLMMRAGKKSLPDAVSGPDWQEYQVCGNSKWRVAWEKGGHSIHQKDNGKSTNEAG